MDLATVLLLHKSSLLVGAACFLYERWQSGKSQGLDFMAAAFILLALASTLAGMGELDALPFEFWTLGSFALGMVAYSLFWIGARRLGRDSDRTIDWLIMVVPILLTAIALATEFYRDNFSRATVFQLSAITFLCTTAVMLLRDGRRQGLAAGYPLAAALMISALFSLLTVIGLWVPSITAISPGNTFFALILCQFAIALFVLIFVKERVEARLKALVEVDTLTKVHNRHWFFLQLPIQANQGDVFVIIDIDHFKRVNDTYGHAVGDSVLTTVAAIMAAALNKGDIFARLGGEEFALYLAADSGRDPVAVAEALRHAVQSTPIRHGDLTIAVTISAGFAMAQAGQSLKALMSEADIALYSAKGAGRNRVAQYHPDADMRRDVSPADQAA